jgi:hypothetical protein
VAAQGREEMGLIYPKTKNPAGLVGEQGSEIRDLYQIVLPACLLGEVFTPAARPRLACTNGKYAIAQAGVRIAQKHIRAMQPSGCLRLDWICGERFHW